ncbi:MAG TPA: ZIP family metal transporter [Legionellaceae bacterium]|nr:ZIP family metal transporter [Legionellaceae bacterium]
MMTPEGLKIFFALSVVIVILLAGWYPFKNRYSKSETMDFPIGETLATGVFLGAGLLHLLPESAAEFSKQGYQYPLAYLITGLIFLLFLWFEHLGRELYHHQKRNHPAFALLAWLMLSVHSLVLGTALGFSKEYSLAIMLYLAIITHKWAESFAIAMQLSKCSLKISQSMALFIIFALMTPLGIYIGWYLGHGVHTQTILDPILIAISAGTFLYLGTLHGLEQCVMVERCCNLRYFSFVIIGFLLMGSVALYI